MLITSKKFYDECCKELETVQGENEEILRRKNMEIEQLNLIVKEL